MHVDSLADVLHEAEGAIRKEQGLGCTMHPLEDHFG